MGKYCASLGVLRGPWDQVFAAFWQRYPNPYSKHVLTEDIVHREVTADQKLLSRRLLTKTNRMPRWAERFFPANVSHSVYILEDSIVDPQNRTMTTYTWNINHARLMVVEERCVYCVNPENSSWTEVKREAWVSSSLFGVSRAIQEFGLARFKSNVTKSTRGFEYVLAKMQGLLPAADSEATKGMLEAGAVEANKGTGARAHPVVPGHWLQPHRGCDCLHQPVAQEQEEPFYQGCSPLRS
ncbi:PRELI domain-containing protein 1, mitochondrial isoform X1 [Dermochelys coriacea]|uniref:PRELI domain-containing protein 1, mitochondrial isoform X1 n=1 Tax=Dermochelys coriacea TaxID=27794 RepID=UPI001CA8442E|nr:PRELI domain-containing protein 1, mitochondrial isoform X1 [Dermochelys coriacea]